jgi:hypothetical protein
LGKKFGIYLFLKNCYGPILEKKSPAIEVKNAILPIFWAQIFTQSGFCELVALKFCGFLTIAAELIVEPKNGSHRAWVG